MREEGLTMMEDLRDKLIDLNRRISEMAVHL